MKARVNRIKKLSGNFALLLEQERQAARAQLDALIESIRAISGSAADVRFQRLATQIKALRQRLDLLAEMGRGKGVRLQRYKDGGISDLKTFWAADGLTWTDSSGRTYTKPTEELTDWLGDRATAGRQPPNGFPRNNRFVG